MGILLFIVGLLGFVGSIVLLILSFVRRRSKKTALIILAISVVLIMVGPLMDSGDDTPEVADETEEDIEEDKDIGESEESEQDRKSKLESAIKSRVEDGDYRKANIDSITIKDNMGDAEGETYIALVYLEFGIKNKAKTANNMMRMYSDDLSASLANEGIDDIAEIAIFWEDDYNDRTVKYAYEYKDGDFYIMDVAGE